MEKQRSSTKSRIFLVEDNALVCEGLRRLLNSYPDFAVCGESNAVSAAAEAIPALHPDIAIVDLCLDGHKMDGIELIRRIHEKAVRPPVLVLSAHEELIFAPKALHAGASGYIMKQDARKHLAAAVREVLAGRTYLSEAAKNQFTNKSGGSYERD